MKTKTISSIAVIAAAAAMLFTGCGGGSEKGSSQNSTESAATVETPPISVPEDVTILNYTPPEKGEKIAVITVKDYGEIKIKLFPEAAQKGVENFIGLAEMNYYDELIFHRVIPHFMIQGGDPKGTGTGGSSIWGEKFDGGIPEGLYHLSGAVAYANSQGPTTNGSQFYIVNTEPGELFLGGYRDADGNIKHCTTFEEAKMVLPENLKQMYMEKGGTPSLDGGYTVFGQVFEGLDVVRAIARVETDENDKPLTQVLMETVRIVEYEG